jgi:hypothetical protein
MFIFRAAAKSSIPKDVTLFLADKLKQYWAREIRDGTTLLEKRQRAIKSWIWVTMLISLCKKIRVGSTRRTVIKGATCPKPPLCHAIYGLSFRGLR